MALLAYGSYDTDAVSEETALFCPEETMAQQQFAENCDINVIMARFGQGYQIPEGHRMPTYGDFDGIHDYREALDFIREAGESFMELPANIRERFGNDPANLIDFLGDEANRAEAQKLGLLDPDRDSRILDVTVPGDTKVTSLNSTGDFHETQTGQQKTGSKNVPKTQPEDQGS
jgi:phage internal scaffolding protein